MGASGTSTNDLTGGAFTKFNFKTNSKHTKKS